MVSYSTDRALCQQKVNEKKVVGQSKHGYKQCRLLNVKEKCTNVYEEGKETCVTPQGHMQCVLVRKKKLNVNIALTRGQL